MLGRIKVPRFYLIFLLNIIFYQVATAEWTKAKGETEFKFVQPYHSTASGKFISPISWGKDLLDNTHYLETTGMKANEVHYYAMETDDDLLVMNVTQDPRMTEEVMADIGDVTDILPECILAGSIVGDPDSRVVINHCDANGWICGTEYDYHLHESANDALLKLHRLDKSSIWRNDLRHAAVPRSVCLRQHGRGRRSIHTNQKFSIELAMLVDYSIQTFYGEETKEYILKLMKIAAESFRHPSLGFNVELVISKTIYLDKHNSSLMIDDSSPTRTRRNVGQFMYRLNSLDDANPEHFDAGVYITRDNFGPKGYAKTGGMCNLQENTVLVRDEGYKSAYVVAHEIGHLLNMEHDGDGNACQKDISQQSIMSAEVMSTYNVHRWSKCSKDNFEQFVTSSRGWCMQDEPFRKKVIELPMDAYPGVGVSLNQQCRAQFDDGYVKCNTFFSDSVLCGMLWCMKGDNPYSCSQKESPPLDGTPCGKNKMCKDGSCIKAPKISKPKVVNGGWTKWGEFSECSLSCGVGISSRERKCTNPEPKNGGNYCEGERMEHIACNVQECPGKKTDIRADLCKEQNQVLVPADAEKESERCLLTCVSKASTSGRVVTIGSVPDGTPCSYDDPTSICLHGTCTQLGCDNVVGSKAEVDKCGVCLGNNDSCKTNKEAFKKKVKKSSYVIANIPAGARHFRVVEKKKNGHCIVLRNVDTGENLIDTRSIEWQTTSSKSVISAGVKFTFSIRNGLRVITSSPGPILNKLSVKVYRNKTETKAPSIVCTFVTKQKEMAIQYLSAKRATFMKTIKKSTPFEWVKDGVSECSATCGGGFQRDIYKCKRVTDMKVVHDGKCRTEAPKSQKSCAEKSCKSYSWDISPWNECSKTCGQGEMTRSVVCVRDDSGKIKNAKFCAATSPRPKTTETCNERPC